MPNWKSTIKIKDLHDAYEAGTMSISDVGKELAKRCRSNSYIKAGISEDSPMYDEELVVSLMNLEDGVSDVEEYDMCLENIYYFADFNHQIWIDTTSN